jgi:hypothetical protein
MFRRCTVVLTKNVRCTVMTSPSFWMDHERDPMIDEIYSSLYFLSLLIDCQFHNG